MKIWCENIGGIDFWFCKRAFITGLGLDRETAIDAFYLACKAKVVK